MGYRDHHKSEGSQGNERDTRKTPGKVAKPPPMGAKRGRNESDKKGSRRK